MLASFLTAFLFAVSAVCAGRTARLIGSFTANFVRLWLSTAVLAVWAFGFGGGLQGPGLYFLVLSGVVGFGFSDLAFFAALPLIGSRLASLMVQCLAAPFAALMEWLWLGTRLSGLELACSAAILVGVGLAIAPSKAVQTLQIYDAQPQHGRGLFYGLLAALNQAGAAVLSRKAYAVSQASNIHIDGGTAAFQRIVGGLFVATVTYPIFRRFAAMGRSDFKRDWRTAWPWIAVNCLAGATVGVSCLQWALATTPSAVVLPIVALTPLVVVPFAYFLDGERPGARSLAGAALAVGAAAALARVR